MNTKKQKLRDREKENNDEITLLTDTLKEYIKEKKNIE